MEFSLFMTFCWTLSDRMLTGCAWLVPSTSMSSPPAQVCLSAALAQPHWDLVTIYFLVKQFLGVLPFLEPLQVNGWMWAEWVNERVSAGQENCAWAFFEGTCGFYFFGHPILHCKHAFIFFIWDLLMKHWHFLVECFSSVRHNWSSTLAKGM